MKTALRRAAVIAALLAGMAGGANAKTVQIEVKSLAFSPASATAQVGDTIEWVNRDFVAHTATARNGAWDVQLPAHGSGQTTVKNAGDIEYYCRFHPTMKATITVAP